MFAVALTDQDWFEYQRDDSPVDEVNFWTPTPWSVQRLVEGDRWYFLLKSPIRKLGGYGYFAEYEDMSVGDAWEKFGGKNGVASLSELLDRCERYSSKHSMSPVQGIDSVIGCIVLTNPVFFDDEELIDPAAAQISVPQQVVKFKYFHGKEPAVATTDGHVDEFKLVGNKPTDYSRQRRKDRKGQQQFRQSLLQAYDHRCAITREPNAEVLEATHIEPYVDRASNHVQNGILMRVDLHRLFDAGLLGIDQSFSVLVSSQLRESRYVELAGRKLTVPHDSSQKPSSVAIAWHKRERFRA